MNKNVLLLLSLALFSTITGMDPRLRAQVHQWQLQQEASKKYQREQEALKIVEEEKKRQEEQQDCLTPRLRAMIEQWEHEQAIEKKEKQSLSIDDMTLTNGYQVSVDFFLKECPDLEILRKSNYELFAQLVKKAQNSDYEIKDDSVVQQLKEQYLLLPDGTVQESVRNILLCGVHEENGKFMLYDPTLQKKSRCLFDSRAITG